MGEWTGCESRGTLSVPIYTRPGWRRYLPAAQSRMVCALPGCPLYATCMFSQSLFSSVLVRPGLPNDWSDLSNKLLNYWYAPFVWCGLFNAEATLLSSAIGSCDLGCFMPWATSRHIGERGRARNKPAMAEWIIKCPGKPAAS